MARRGFRLRRVGAVVVLTSYRCAARLRPGGQGADPGDVNRRARACVGASGPRLWVAWCHATGRDPLLVDDETLGAYNEQVPGGPLPPGARQRPGAVVLDSPIDDLGHYAAQGWPSGFRGRRDAWLHLLVEQAEAGLSRSLALTAADLHARDDERVEVADLAVASHTGENPLACPACAVARWLECLEAAWRWGRTGVRDLLRAPLGEDHLAAGSTLDRLPSWTILAPAIDQHGWACEWRPMSRRAASAIRHAPRPTAVNEEPSPRPASQRVIRWLGEIPGPARHVSEEEAEEIYLRADEVNARVREALRAAGG